MLLFRPLATAATISLVLILPLAAASLTTSAAEPQVSMSLAYPAETGRSGWNTLTKHATPFVQGQAGGKQRVEVIEGDRVVGTAIANDAGKWEARLSSLSDGRHVLHARVQTGGKTVLSKPAAFVVDTKPPKPPTLKLAAGADTGASKSDGRTRYRQVPVEGRADRQTEVVLVHARGRLVALDSNVGRSWSARTETLRPGEVVLTAVARDAAGNESEPSAPLRLEIVSQKASVNLKTLDGKGGVALWAPSFDGGCSTGQGQLNATDLNGDGRDDVILPGTRVKMPGPDGERQQTIFGVTGWDADTDGKVDVTDPRPGQGFAAVAGDRMDLLGGSVTTVGDVDGDGLGDFAVWATQSAGRDINGRLTVVYGDSAGLPTAIDLRTIGPAQGFHVVGNIRRDGPYKPLLGIGDVNGDGLGDIMFRSGKALQVLFGEAGRTRNVLRPSQLGRNDGVAIRLPRGGEGLSFAHGDVNGDGLADILVGGAGGGVGGSVSIVLGRPRFPADPALDDVADLLLTNAADAYDAPRLASGFDLDGDGKDEIAVLASHDIAFDMAGKGVVVFGAAALKSRPIDLGRELAPRLGFRLAAPPVHGWALQSAAGAGDVNGDGFGDLVLSTDLGGRSAGFLVYGRKLPFPEAFDLAGLDGAEGYRLESAGRTGASERHCSVGSAGDFNGDGLDDLLITGETGGRMSQPGAAMYVVFGRSE